LPSKKRVDTYHQIQAGFKSKSHEKPGLRVLKRNGTRTDFERRRAVIL